MVKLKKYENENYTRKGYSISRTEALVDDIAPEELELWQIWLADSIDGLKVHEFRINDLTVAVLREHFGNNHFEHPVCLKIRL